MLNECHTNDDDTLGILTLWQVVGGIGEVCNHKVPRTKSKLSVKPLCLVVVTVIAFFPFNSPFFVIQLL